jgi:hypothetical protein
MKQMMKKNIKEKSHLRQCITITHTVVFGSSMSLPMTAGWSWIECPETMNPIAS